MRECDLLDNTLIILTSDNGPVVDDGYADRAEELLGEHSPTADLRGGKYSAFEGGTRVPFIVSHPRLVERGGCCDALISQVDFVPVMAARAGVELPASVSPDGGNYLALWLGKGGEERPYVVSQASNHTLSIRTRDWK